jgi:pimeloyl-ACP methyl ester carboxylesterase
METEPTPDVSGAGQPELSHLVFNPVADGPTLVLIHGLGANKHYWDAVVEALGADVRVVTLDLPGFGQSRRRRGTYTTAGAAIEIARLLQRLKVGPAILVGHSFGGLPALAVAAAGTCDVQRVVLVDAHLMGAYNLLKHPASAVRHPRLAVACLGLVLSVLLPGRVRMARFAARYAVLRRLLFWPFSPDPAALPASLLRQAFAHSTNRAGPSALRDAHRLGLRELAVGVNCPATLVWGASDRFLSPTDTTTARAVLLVDVEHELPACGHWPMLEQPIQLAELLRTANRTVPAPADPAGGAGDDPPDPEPPLSNYADVDNFWIVRQLRALPLKILWACVPIPLLLAFAGALLSHTATQGHGRAWPNDVVWALSLGNPPTGATTTFSLWRDIGSMLLILAIGFIPLSLRHLANQLTNCVEQLETGGVLVWKTSPEIARLHWVRRSAATREAEKWKSTAGRAAFQRWQQNRFAKAHLGNWLFLPGAAALAGILQWAEAEKAAFSYLAVPAALHKPSSPALASNWHRPDIYATWWASYHHQWAFAAYALIAAAAIYLILVQNALAFISVMSFLHLNAFAALQVNWDNPDGAYGWLALKRLFRTVYASLAMRGFMLGSLILSLGLQNLRLLISITALWAVFLGIYLVAPYYAMERFLDRAKDVETQRLAVLADAERSTAQGYRRERLTRFFRDEMATVRSAALHPMQGRPWESPGLFLVVLLPVILTVVQIFA